MKKDILNFPLFNFKAKPAKSIEVKSKRVSKVKADKGKSKRGADNIMKFFVKLVYTTKTSRPTKQHTADKLALQNFSNLMSDPS